MDLSNKVIIITGASSGIGEACAHTLAKAGAKLMLAARREERLQKLSEELGDQAIYHVTDVTDYEQVENMVKATLEKWGRLDVLINNAGLGHLAPLEDSSIEDWHRMVNVNITGVLNCLHASLPPLIDYKGHVINLSSVAGHNVFPNAVVYCGTKHFISALRKGFRQEFRDKVKITNISPGAVETEFINQITHPDLKEQFEKNFVDVLKAEDIAESILHVLTMPAHTVINELIIRPNK